MEYSKYAKILLKKRLTQRLVKPGDFSSPIAGVTLHRRDEATEPEHCIRKPCIVQLAQGRKCSLVGGEEFIYGENEIFVACVALPDTSAVIEASPEKPGIGLSVELDKNLIAQLAMEMPAICSKLEVPSTGFIVQSMDSDMLDAFLRLEALLDKPEQIQIMGPLLIKEIHFRALLGLNGHKLRMFYSYGTQKNQIAKAIAWLEENYKERFAVKELAERVHMAPTTFHRHFKEVTAVSPLQFQKRLRLHEAQRIMIKENMDIGDACEAVGYESITQFNREYKRLFGEPPRRSMSRWHDRSIDL